MKHQRKKNPNSNSLSSMNDSVNDDQLTDYEIAKILAETDEVSDDQALQILFDEMEHKKDENLLTAISTELTDKHGLDVLWDITGVNCAAHTLQLAVKDAVNIIDQKHQNVIQLCRRVAKVLHLKSTQNEMNNLGMRYKQPQLDVETRWGSTQLMVRLFFYFFICLLFSFYRFFFYFSINLQLEGVYNCHDVVKYYAETKKVEVFRLLLKKWTVLKEMVYVLRIPFKATISLQDRSLTLSDTYGIWLKMELHLKAFLRKKNYKTDLAKNLLSAIDDRKKNIFENPLMSAALFLDPRYRNQITNNEEKAEQAKETLKKIWRRLIISRGSNQESFIQSSINVSSSSDISFEYDDWAELNKFLAGSTNQLEQEPNQSQQNVSHQDDIEYLLNTFAPETLSSENSIFAFWEEVKEKHLQLYELAMVVFCVPPTEVQIERDFSKLKFVFSDRRCGLTEERLEDIMIIHLNDELFYEVKAEEIKELYESFK